jgi:hypothetical protein
MGILTSDIGRGVSLERRRRTRRRTVAAAIACVVLLGLADPAVAGTNARVRTRDADPGGEAYFRNSGDKLLVCDLQTDGYKAIAGLEYDGHVVQVLDDGSTNGRCESLSNGWIPEGSRVRIQVCLIRGSGPNRFCSAWKSATA